MEHAASGGHIDIVDRMIELGANDYNRAMWSAAGGGFSDGSFEDGIFPQNHIDIVKRMLELGANNYNNAIFKAEQGGNWVIVKLIENFRDNPVAKLAIRKSIAF